VGSPDGREAWTVPSPRDSCHVGIGEICVSYSPDVLVALALGSCVGVAIYDPVRRMGGLAHVMLPCPTDAHPSATLDRFASYAVPYLVRRLSVDGASDRLTARIVGGAAMFASDSAMAGIGQRNADEARRQLALAGVPVLAEDIGSNHARTMEFYLETGKVLARSYRYGIKEL